MYFINLDRTTTKRFDFSKFMEFRDGAYDPGGAYFLQELRKLKQYGVYTVRDGAARPDNVSFDIYKDTQFWWLLMIYNNILDFQQIKLGMNLRYFSLDDLETLYFQLKARSLGVSGGL